MVNFCMRSRDPHGIGRRVAPDVLPMMSYLYLTLVAKVCTYCNVMFTKIERAVVKTHASRGGKNCMCNCTQKR